METRKKKIIRVFEVYGVPQHLHESIADTILAIPLDVMSEEEINKYLFEVWLGREDKVDITFNNGVVNGIRWFKEQVERRNQIVSNDFDLPKQDEYRNLDKDKYK